MADTPTDLEEIDPDDPILAAKKAQGATPDEPADDPISMRKLNSAWHQAWPKALETWSSFTMLREPEFYTSDKIAARDYMAGEIAAIRLLDQTVMVNLATIRGTGLENFALEVLAHEIGHHVYVPGNLSDHARMLAAIKPIYSGMPNGIPHMLANLYGDLMINDRLQRRGNLDMAGVYKKMKAKAEAFQDGENKPAPPSEVWKVYTRTYEKLWRLTNETISPPDVSKDADLDAILLARIVRHFAGHWLDGVRRFAYIMYPYVADDEQKKKQQTFVRLGLSDTKRACATGPGNAETDAIPSGLSGKDGWELGEDDDFEINEMGPIGDQNIPPRDGPDRTGRAKKELPKPPNTAPSKEGKEIKGNFREPFEYAELLKTLGLDLKSHEVTTRYYRERALPHLIPFPKRQAPHAVEPLAEGTESWEAGSALDDLDMMSSLIRSPVMIPGVTTEQRVYGETPGSDPARAPMDLDIYVDCSGSMPNPAVHVSYLALAGTILALSALRAGARVQATLWSGAGQFDTSGSFMRDENRILGIVTGYICGATAFPLSVMRETYRNRPADSNSAHIVIISDDGVDTILASDEKGTLGSALCTEALARARGGATMVLNIGAPKWPHAATLEKLGFAIHRVTDWEQLVVFAREFVRRNYEK